MDRVMRINEQTRAFLLQLQAQVSQTKEAAAFNAALQASIRALDLDPGKLYNVNLGTGEITEQVRPMMLNGLAKLAAEQVSGA